MKKQVVIILVLLSTNFSCTSFVLSKNDTPWFKIFNKSSDDLEWIRIYVGDQKDRGDYHKDINLILISENSLKNQGSTLRYPVKLREFSKDGSGYFYVFAKKVGSKDTLSRLQFWRYENFDISDNDYRGGYNTFEIEVFDKSTLVPSEIATHFTKYKGESRIQ